MKKCKRTCILLAMSLVVLSGCTASPPCCNFYQDYPWGDYPWESRHYNPSMVWDDYYHDTGTHWRGQEGSYPIAQ